MAVEKTRCGGRWTESRFQSFIKSTLRRATVRWGVVTDVKNEAFVGRFINKDTGRLAKHFKCAGCRGHFPDKLIAVDHVEPVVPVTGFTSWDDIINRMFCEKDNLQVLCKSCHDIKTLKEKELRKKHKEKKC